MNWRAVGVRWDAAELALIRLVTIVLTCGILCIGVHQMHANLLRYKS